MSCGTLTGSLTLDCAAPIRGGIEGKSLYLFNFDDWQEADVTITAATLKIEAINLDGTDKMWQIEQPGTGNVTSTIDLSYEVGITRYKHVVNFLVAKGDAATALIAQKLMQGLFVAAYITKDSKIMVLGAGTGLKATAQTVRDFNASASAFTLQLASEDTSLESLLPYEFVGSVPGDFVTAKSEFLALLV